MSKICLLRLSAEIVFILEPERYNVLVLGLENRYNVRQKPLYQILAAQYLGALSMPTLSKATRLWTIFTMGAAVGIVVAVAYVCHLKSGREPRSPSAPKRPDAQSEDLLDGEGLSPGEQVSLGRLLGTNNPAVPPVIMRMGPRPSEVHAPDLSTPATAVYSVLSLIDQDVTDKLAACFIDETAETAGNLYPSYLGHPTELVDLFKDDESAVVVWNATVHTAFSLDGRSWSAGEKMRLTTRLSKVEDLWKLLRLHEGVKDDSQ